jgi:hypothetical protein
MSDMMVLKTTGLFASCLVCGYFAGDLLALMIDRCTLERNKKSIKAFQDWYRTNFDNIDKRQLAKLKAYLDYQHLRHISMSSDTRGILLKLYYTGRITVDGVLINFAPTFCIVHDATVKSRIHIIMVPPTIRSCTAGLAWSFDLTKKEYKYVMIEA